VIGLARSAATSILQSDRYATAVRSQSRIVVAHAPATGTITHVHITPLLQPARLPRTAAKETGAAQSVTTTISRRVRSVTAAELIDLVRLLSMEAQQLLQAPDKRRAPAAVVHLGTTMLNRIGASLTD